MQKQKEDVLDKLEKKRKFKIIATITIIAALITILTFISFSIYSYYKSPERELGLGANIESALISEDAENVYIKLIGGSYVNVTKIKFIFTDSGGNEYVYETTEGISEIEVPYSSNFWDWLFKRQLKGVYDYEISLNNVEGLGSFEDVEVSVSFEYKTEEGEVVESPELDTAKPKPVSTGSTSSSSNGGTPPPSDGTTTPETCTNDAGCSSEGSFCDDNIPYNCSLESDGCLDRVNGSECGSGYYCSGGSCKEIISYEADYYVDSLLTTDCNSYNVSARTCGNGDKTAYNTIQEAADVLQAGETVAVREGIYRESVTLSASGTPTQRITIRNYPGERPIIDGSELFNGWQRCDGNCDDLKVNGVINKDYSNIFWVEVDESELPADVEDSILFEDSEYLYLAQESNQINNAPDILQDLDYMIDLSEEAWNHSDGSIYSPDPDCIGGELVIVNATYNYTCGVYSYILDSDFLGTNIMGYDQDENYWNGARLFIYSINYNSALINRNVNYSNGSYIYFDELMTKPIAYSSTIPDKYSIANHPHVLDTPGEFIRTSLIDGKYKIYLWPKSEDNLDKITYSKLKHGFYGYWKNFTTIEGFEIKNMKSDGILIRSDKEYKISDSINVRNCYVHNNHGWGIYFIYTNNSLAENNVAYQNTNGRGIMCNIGNGCIIRNNTVDRNVGTQISFYYMTNSEIINNTIGSGGVHSNGISVYNYNYNILISGNKLVDSGITFNEGTNIIVKDNLIYYNLLGIDRIAIACWSNFHHNYTIIHNTLIGDKGLWCGGDLVGWTVKDNIIHGRNEDLGVDAIFANNIYTAKFLGSDSITLTETEAYEPNLDKLFVDVSENNFHPFMTSYACPKGNSNLASGEYIGALPCVPKPCPSGLDSECDDENLCTDDFCNAGLVCENNYNSDPCSDGYDCTIGDFCSDGVCQSGNPDNSRCLIGYSDCVIATCDPGLYSATGCGDYSPEGCAVPSGYISYWKFEGNTDDEAGVNNGTWMGDDEIYSDGQVGQALEFDGDGDYVYVDLKQSLIFTANYTMTAWVNKIGNAFTAILKQGQTTNNINLLQYDLEIINDALYFNTGNGTASDSYIIPSAITYGNWYFIACTINSTGYKLCYINGVEKTGQQESIVPGEVPSQVSFLIGETSGRYFNGSIDEVMIYNRSLSESEIQQIYCSQGGDAGFCGAPAGNVYYVLPDGIGSGTECSDVNPCNLSYIKQNVQPGGIVYLKDGNYGEVTFDSNTKTGTADKWITYKADSGENPVFIRLTISGDVNRYIEFNGISIVMPYTGWGSWCVKVTDSDYLRLINLNMEGTWLGDGVATSVGIAVEASAERGINNVLVEGCEIQDISRGMFINYCGDNIVIKNNYIHHIVGSGISLWEDMKENGIILIEGNEIYYQDPGPDTHGSGIEIRCSNLTIRGNIIHACGNTRPIRTYGTNSILNTPGEPYDHSNMLIENNLIYDALNWYPVEFTYIGNNFVFRNNTVIGKRDSGGGYGNALFLRPGVDQQGSGFSMYNNILVGNMIIYFNKPYLFKENNNIIFEHSEPTLTGEVTNTKIIRVGGVPVYDINYFEGAGNFFSGGSDPDLFNQYSYTYPDPDYYPSTHKQNLNDAYYPVMTSDACNGNVTGSSYAESGNYVGALPCVCTNNPQCINVYGAQYICDIPIGNCCEDANLDGICDSLLTLPPLTTFWNWLKGLLTRETGNAVLTGSVIDEAKIKLDNNEKINVSKIVLGFLIVSSVIIISIVSIVKVRQSKRKRRRRYKNRK